MTLRLHDTATRETRDFVPLEQGRAGIYVCGLTVQSEPHVGLPELLSSGVASGRLGENGVKRLESFQRLIATLGS